jgi:hypothetical protein
MATEKPRIDYSNLTRGQIIALNIEHPDALFMYPSSYIAIKGDSIDYSSYLNSSLYGSGSSSTQYTNSSGEINTISPVFDNLLDVPSLTDIESVNFEPYYDTVAKIQKVRAIIKIRNSSKNSIGVESVDTRIFNPNTVIVKVDTLGTNQSAQFITPTPEVPNVVFKRDGTTISWGWDNVGGLGSYQSIFYEWIISTSSSLDAPVLNSGSEPYSTTGNLPIGKSNYVKSYRVSSQDGDTTTTSAARWLRVRTKVVGKDNNTYYSNYSTPI